MTEDERYEAYIRKMYKPEKNLTLHYICLAIITVIMIGMVCQDLQPEYNSEAAEHIEKIKSQPVKLVKHKLKKKINY